MRIDRHRLETSAFPVMIAIQSRFSDLDVQGICRMRPWREINEPGPLCLALAYLLR
jgi:hypothetical protein